MNGIEELIQRIRDPNPARTDGTPKPMLEAYYPKFANGVRSGIFTLLRTTGHGNTFEIIQVAF